MAVMNRIHIHVHAPCLFCVQELEIAGIKCDDDPRFYGFLTRLEGLPGMLTRDQFQS
jgi:hypothetical protein